MLSESELIKIKKNVKDSIENMDRLTLDFNTLALTDYVSLYTHVLRIFLCSHVHQTLDISTLELLDFLIDVSKQYKIETYYHTFHHAVDVMTMLYYLIYQLDAYPYLSKLDIASLMIAALCHDIGHPGFTNAFQVKNQTELAMKYGTKSTLESYSVDLTLALLRKHQFRHNQLEDMIGDLILSTDMENHLALEHQAYHLASCIHTPLPKTYWTRRTLSHLLLHAADISNMARPWKISKLWSDRITQEFLIQGDQEKKQKMPVSPGMDRDTVSQAANSIRFGQFILPFFQALVSILPKSRSLMDSITENCIRWEKEVLEDAYSTFELNATTPSSCSSVP
ncbi:3',5'-cyclic-nucleotide phosphodiesterase regA [Choanephora cucurbitarum]|uniref:3',5'-cyclic-nucleotide phosphodiesterase regA n=1 Tax=Choanephora cucurbitarum TaxID=101091 RepID=A0A1C7N509_9FUNG|nr:3',5'-cyclic-nucleotide phosphodiesterase regA [Choanephora cucurbitarum]